MNLKSSNARLGIITVALVGIFAAWQMGWIHSLSMGKSVVPTAVELAQTDGATAHPQTSNVGPLIDPCASALAHVTGPRINMNIWAWNAQMAMIGANCGPKTMDKSLMSKYGVNLNLTRQDDTSISQTGMIKFATQLAGGNPNPGDGVHFVVIMGDGASQYLHDCNKSTTKLGPDFRCEIVGAVGFSGNKISGEDAFMGQADWKDDAQRAKGSLIAGVVRDGDWNIAQAWANTNGVPNNPDDRYYDPDAINWVNTASYTEAAKFYVENKCETRYVVHSGKVTTQQLKVCVNGVVTWTPGDVTVAKKRGGLVKLLSTKENYMQMPAVLIGIHAWNESHPKQVEGLLRATFEYADQLRAYPELLKRASRASYAVYQEENAAYWEKYYKGVVEPDATGQPVPLGGSRVANLADNMFLFGMTDEVGLNNSAFNASYAGFGRVISGQYPKILPSFPPTGEAVNLRFLNDLVRDMVPTTKADRPTFESKDTIDDVVSRQNVSIEFNPGSSQFTANAQATLDRLFGQLANATALNVQIDGHTDNTGTPEGNEALSLARARSVKDYFAGRNRTLFPEERMSIHGFGQNKPVADNATPEGRARNRRVTITLGN